MQKQPQHRQPLIVKSHTTDEKFQTFEFKASSAAPWLGQQTVAHTHQSPEPYNVQQTLQRFTQRSANVSQCQQHRRKHQIQVALLRRRAAMTRAILPHASACAAPLAGGQPDDVPVLHNAYTIQQVVHTEFRMLQQLSYELATLTPHGLV